MASATGSKDIPVVVFGAAWARKGVDAGPIYSPASGGVVPPPPYASSSGALYDESVKLGGLLSRASCHVFTGGYAGTMHGCSEGASLAGGSSTGVTVPALFDGVAVANPHLSRELSTGSLCDRIGLLEESSRYFVLLPGTLGTLTELCVVWNNATICALPRSPPVPAPRRPLILAYREPWARVVSALAGVLAMPPHLTEFVRFVDSAEEAVGLIVAEEAAEAERGKAVGV